MYTVEQIREMPAGLELNELVRKLTHTSLVPSMISQDAWYVLQRFCRMHKAYWVLGCENKDGQCSCDIYCDHSESLGLAFGDTAALAICRAIVLAAMRWRLV